VIRAPTPTHTPSWFLNPELLEFAKSSLFVGDEIAMKDFFEKDEKV